MPILGVRNERKCRLGAAGLASDYRCSAVDRARSARLPGRVAKRRGCFSADIARVMRGIARRVHWHRSIRARKGDLCARDVGQGTLTRVFAHPGRRAGASKGNRGEACPSAERARELAFAKKNRL